MNKKLYLPITATLAIIALVLFPDFVFAGDYGLTATAKTAGLAGESDLSKIVGNIIGTALSMISVLFFALILYGGFLWMTSRGNSDQENKAKDTIFGAVVGIIIILAAYAITNFVFTNLGPGAGGGSAPTTPTGNSGSSGSPNSGSGGNGSSSGSSNTNKATKQNSSIHEKGESCKSDIDCLKGLSCINKICDTIGSNQTNSVASGGTCSTSTQCQSGLTCLAGKCSTGQTSSGTSGKGTICISDSQCKTGLSCTGSSAGKTCQ